MWQTRPQEYQDTEVGLLLSVVPRYDWLFMFWGVCASAEDLIGQQLCRLALPGRVRRCGLQ